MIKLKRYILIFSIMLILMASCSLVSAASDVDNDSSFSTDMVNDVDETDSSQTVEILENSETINITDNEDSLDSKKVDDKVKSFSQSSTPVVGNTFEDIQNAIDNANDGDIIELSGTYTGSGSSITVNKSLTLQGSGNAILYANALSGIFDIVAGNTVSIKNLEFYNSSGGYVINNSGTLNISCSLFKNIKNGDYAAIYSISELNIEESSFINCSSYSAGAIYAYLGIIKIINSSFVNCSSESAGVIFSRAKLSIFDSNFTNCEGFYGNVIRSSSDVFINNTIFYQCSAIEDNDFGTIYIRANFIPDNGNLTKVIISNTIFNNSKSAINLYGKYLDNHSLIENSIFTNNFHSGSLIYSSPFINIKNCNFINNTALYEYDTNGGALYLSDGASISNCNFINNTVSGNGGAIFSKGNTSVINSKFEGNKAKVHGNDIYNAGNLSLSNNTLTNDFATFYNANYDSNSMIKSPVTLIILDNSTRKAYEGTPFTVYAKLVDDNGNLIEDERISLNIGSEKKTVFFNEKNGLYEYTLNNVKESILVYGSYDGATDLTVKTGYITFSNQSGGGEIVPVIANGTIDFISNEESVAIILKDLDGKPISNGVLSVNLNGIGSTLLTNTNGQANIAIKGNSTLKVVYTDNNGATVSSSIVLKETEKIIEKNNTIYVNQTVEVPVYVVPNASISLITNDGSSVILTLTDNDGKAISNANVQISKNGEESTVTTDPNGKATIDINGNTTLVASYRDSNNLTTVGYLNIVVINNITERVINNTVEVPVYINNTVYVNVTPNRTDTRIISSNMNTISVPSVDGRIGEYFKVTLVDASGKPLALKPIEIGFNGKSYPKMTDSNGQAQLQINLPKIGRYTFAICYLGDDNYTGSFKVALITVNPQTPKLTATAKTFKASAKTKTISATFKTANNHGVSGRKVTFTINGKTYSATTNSKGVANVKISLNKKGTYSAIAKFAGDNIFKATSTKFNVKIA